MRPDRFYARSRSAWTSCVAARPRIGTQGHFSKSAAAGCARSQVGASITTAASSSRELPGPSQPSKTPGCIRLRIASPRPSARRLPVPGSGTRVQVPGEFVIDPMSIPPLS